jgi:hypothetical protein
MAAPLLTANWTPRWDWRVSGTGSAVVVAPCDLGGSDVAD